MKSNQAKEGCVLRYKTTVFMTSAPSPLNDNMNKEDKLKLIEAYIRAFNEQKEAGAPTEWLGIKVKSHPDTPKKINMRQLVNMLIAQNRIEFRGDGKLWIK